MIKQEMTRVNIDILGIRELRWTGIGEFNSDDTYKWNLKYGTNKCIYETETDRHREQTCGC